MKYMVLNGTLGQTKDGLGSVIQKGTLQGPAMNSRFFFRWARLNYPEGMPEGGLFGKTTVDTDVVRDEIPVSGSDVVWVDRAFVDLGDYYKFAEQWMLANHPDLYATNWRADIFDDNVIEITFEDDTTESFSVPDFDKTKTYIYAYYRVLSPPVSGDYVLETEGDETGPFEEESSLPSLTGYDLIGENEYIAVEKELTETIRTVISYDNDDPDDVSETTDVVSTTTYNKFVQTFQRTFTSINYPGDPARIVRPRRNIFVWKEPKYEIVEDVDESSEVIDGVVVTTTITTWTQVLVDPAGEDWYFKEDLYYADLGRLEGTQMFIYEVGTGNANLDALALSVEQVDGFYPMIPLRIDNKFIDAEPYDETIFEQAKKAYKRSSGGGKISKMLEVIEDNENLEDIDYAFIIWGVPLNTQSKYGLRYIFEFLKYMEAIQIFDRGIYEENEEHNEEVEEDHDERENGDGATFVPPPTHEESENVIRTHCTHPDTEHYDFRLYWKYVESTTGVGLGKPDAKINEFWIEKEDPKEFIRSYWTEGDIERLKLSVKDTVFSIYHQVSATSHSRIVVVGMNHRNFVYNGKSVDIDSDEALDDVDDSGLIIPMHFSTVKQLPITWANQLMSEAQLIVFNVYEEKKLKWYQTIWFRILLTIFSIVIGAWMSGGASVLGGGGLIGSNAAIGAMFGLTGIQGAIAGAILNAVASMVLQHALGHLAVKMFGEKWGGLVGMLLGMLVQNFTFGVGGGGMAMNWSQVFSPMNLLALTNAVIGVNTMGVYEQMAELQKQERREMRDLNRQYFELMGQGAGFDPMILTETVQSAFERRDSFHQRTLLTGSDIAEITHGSISAFTDTTLDMNILREHLT